ncbi:Breast cancer anti-estrogen resistance protein 3 [Nymphon striatum]|nr:Breast cancer anti-estrogen resistance protein 3 [Nymphon striatum]
MKGLTPIERYDTNSSHCPHLNIEKGLTLYMEKLITNGRRCIKISAFFIYVKSRFFFFLKKDTKIKTISPPLKIEKISITHIVVFLTSSSITSHNPNSITIIRFKRKNSHGPIQHIMKNDMVYIKTKMVRVGSDPLLSPPIERKPFEFRLSGTLNSSEVMQNFQEQRSLEKPPPKPSRIPSMRSNKKPDVIVRRSNSVIDSDKENYPKNCSDEAFKPSQPNSPVAATCPTLPDKQRQRNLSSESRFSSLRHKRRDSTDSLSLPVKIPITVPSDDIQSTFELDKYKSFLLPSSGENKPLEMNALLHIKSILLDCGSRVLASNLTQMDLKALKADNCNDQGMGITSGFELLLLPQGYQLRLDILERAECMKLFVAVTILMCGNEEERGLMINKWIQVADDSKTALGNLYGFYNVMSGLTLPQIERLESTWLSLRQNYTRTAFTYETKLRPTMKAMHDSTNPEAPNTCIPHVIPMAILLDQIFEPNEIDKKTKPVLNVPWEEPGIDYGLHLLFRHLDTGRNFVKHINTFKRNREIVVDKAKYDQAISDMFCTEFQLKFLWGSKGATVAAQDRYSKFQQVLNVMSNRCENH